MKIISMHGYFEIHEERCGEVSDFSSLFGLALRSKADHFTFPLLQNAPHYSVANTNYLGLNASVTIEGHPSLIFEANGFIYDFSNGVLKPISQVSTRCRFELAGNYFVSPGLVLPGSITPSGEIIHSYRCYWNRGLAQFRYSEVGYV